MNSYFFSVVSVLVFEAEAYTAHFGFSLGIQRRKAKSGVVRDETQRSPPLCHVLSASVLIFQTKEADTSFVWKPAKTKAEEAVWAVLDFRGFLLSSPSSKSAFAKLNITVWNLSGADDAWLLQDSQGFGSPNESLTFVFHSSALKDFVCWNKNIPYYTLTIVLRTCFP